MPQLHEYIEKVIDELENREPSSAMIGDFYDDFDALVDLIADKTTVEPRELRISEESYRARIENIIEDVADADNPVSEFHSQLDELEAEIEDEREEFRILFPLNFRHSDAPGFDSSITVRDVEFHRIAIPVWEEFKETACEEGDFDTYLDELPTRKLRDNPLANQYHWEARYEAAEPDFAMNRVEYALENLHLPLKPF